MWTVHEGDSTFGQTQTHDIFDLQGNPFKIEVEHDFSGGLSKRVTLKFSSQPPNFMTFFDPQDFRLGGGYAKLAM